MFVRSLSDEPGDCHSKNEDRNCQYLGHVQRTAPYRGGSSKHQVSGDVSGEDSAQCEESGQINHSCYDAKQWRQEVLQPRELDNIGVYRAVCGGEHVSAFHRCWHGTALLEVRLGETIAI